MVTTFNTKDLTSFGNYLLSEERKARFKAAGEVAAENGLVLASLEERLQEVTHADIENWKDSVSKVKKVRAKFECSRITDDGSEDKHNAIYVEMQVVIDGSPENKQFSELTPGGNFSLHIDRGTPAVELFEEGREYYIDIIKAPID